MYKILDSAASAKPLALDRVNQLVHEALVVIRGASTVVSARRITDVGLDTPPYSVGYGVAVRRGEIYVFQSIMASNLNAFKTIFHEFFHRGFVSWCRRTRMCRRFAIWLKGTPEYAVCAIWERPEGKV